MYINSSRNTDGGKRETYHVLFNVIILGHLYQCLKQSAMVLDENFTCFAITTLKVVTHEYPAYE